MILRQTFKRHATSKIKDENDLFRIRTLGFRGEAMPSIASVSRFELKSRTGEGVGTRILLEGGIVKELEASSSRKGTDIMVSDLFYNTPARLKYMKTIHTELGNITDVANRLALSHPDVSIRLSHNEKRILHTNGNGDVRQVLAKNLRYEYREKDDSDSGKLFGLHSIWIYRYARGHSCLTELYINDDKR